MNKLKKAMAAFLALSSVAAYAVSASADDFRTGDIDRNGSIDVYDALLVLQNSVSLVDLDDEQLALADIDSDGEVTAIDSLEILRSVVGLSKYTETMTEPILLGNSGVFFVPNIDDEDDEDVFTETKTSTQVSDMKGWSPQDIVATVGPLFTEDQRKTGILASVSCAQFIIESGYGQSRLSLEANNCFGIKGYVGSNWAGSAWDGVSVYNIETQEQEPDGTIYTITDSFRSYDSMEDSIEDHSSYLCTSMNGSKLRYEGIVGCTDYRKAAQIIKNGGYATAINYVDVICSVIENWDLTQYDLKDGEQTYTAPAAEEKMLYRVRKDWDDWTSQIGAYYNLDNARACAALNPGYSIFDENGNEVF